MTTMPRKHTASIRRNWRLTCALLLCLVGCYSVLSSQDGRCKPTKERFVGAIYFRPWTSYDMVVYSVKDLIQTAKRNCTVVHFHGAMEHADVSRYRTDSVLQGNIDVRIVFLRQTRERTDTIAFAQGSYMKVNGKLFPIDRELLDYVAIRIPYGFAYPIINSKPEADR